MTNYEWRIKSKVPKARGKDWLMNVLSKNRGLTTQKKLDDFLNPTIDQILAVGLSDLEKGLARVISAIEKQEKIVVYSDYDADGICATAIMWETLFDLGASVMPHVPHRIKEGYGLSNVTISQMAKENVGLIITVDSGVTAISQVEHAKKLGIDVVVTDHHVLPKELPKPYAMVHSLDLCGAGVSWRFCFEIVRRLNGGYKETLIEKLELAALATVADLVPLFSANRAIVKLGLLKLAQSKRPGLKALIANSGINGQIGTYEIGHILAPRINAMGRIEHGMDSLRLLCTKSEKQAAELARVLSRTNTRRQDLTTSAITRALELIQHEDYLIGLVAHDKWHEGVIGLVASRLVETYHRPMIVIAKGEVYSKGSARSIPGFNIVEAIRASSEYLVDAGGHPMAAGFTIETRHIEIFRERLNKYAEANITSEILARRLEVECELSRDDINYQSLKIIEKFEPYGVANPLPLFLTKKMLVEDVRGVGMDNKHLKLQLSGVSAIGFNLGEMRAEVRPGYLVDVVYTLSEDRYNGDGNIQLKIKDLAIGN